MLNVLSRKFRYFDFKSNFMFFGNVVQNVFFFHFHFLMLFVVFWGVPDSKIKSYFFLFFCIFFQLPRFARRILLCESFQKTNYPKIVAQNRYPQIKQIFGKLMRQIFKSIVEIRHLYFTFNFVFVSSLFVEKFGGLKTLNR